ncbi:hypothetical protein GBA52_008625 [Prunus armeniaca]|nr:hypothetical protein GBA52_008625 [Prunus armeniaca]
MTWCSTLVYFFIPSDGDYVAGAIEGKALLRGYARLGASYKKVNDQSLPQTTLNVDS